MKYNDAFSGFHPINNFLYFGLVTAVTMFIPHPAVLLVSLLGANLYHYRLKTAKAVGFALLYMLPLMLFSALLNPAFNHEGATVLTYLPSGNPLTLEALLYGLNSSVMIIAVITWFSCYTEVMTADKFVYLFGRIIPALSLILSMTLRFVPRFLHKFSEVEEGRSCIGNDIHEGSLIARIKNTGAILSSMIGWSLEASIETADSMKARGYGLPGRTAFSIYTFGSRDLSLLLWLLFCGFCMLVSAAAGLFDWRFYPTIKGASFNPFTLFMLLILLLLVLTPVLLDVYEDISFSKGKTFR